MTIHISDLLQELTDPAGDDILVAVDVSESLPADQTKRALLKRLGLGNGGWIEIPDGSWTYASSTTITVPSGAASIYQVGDEVRLKQGGGYKWYSVIAVADTTLTVTGGSDFSVANAAITDAAFSKGGGVGHPGWYAYTPTLTYAGGTTDPTGWTWSAEFFIEGNKLSLHIAGTLNRGSGDRSILYFGLPLISTHVGQVAVPIVETVVSATETVRAGWIDGTRDRIVIRLSASMTRDGIVMATADYKI